MAGPLALAQSRTYTSTADFNEGTLINLDASGGELKLTSAASSFAFIWIAVSTKGTVVKIDTETGDILGEYRTAPQTFGSGSNLNPSRTTVDNNGSVWVGNRNVTRAVDADAIAPGFPAVRRSMGSAVHIGLVENNECEDRNGNGLIDTSTGQNDIKPWDSGLTGADDLGGVSTAEDECIIHYVRTNSTGTRHVSVDASNDVWISGTGGRYFDLFDGDTGAILRQEGPVGYGGYGGLIDPNGVIWSARPLLRWDTANPLSGPNGSTWTGYGHDSYGLCIDSQGNVWNTALANNTIRKFAPDGTLLGTFSHGNYYSQGCVVDGNDHVWVAHSLLSGRNTVGHLLNDGTYIGNVGVGSGPTGVAVDAAGKVWATNYNSRTASRIDPTAGPVGADGSTPVGAVDFTTVDLGGNPYNYSDMTGSTLTGAPDNGAWTVVYDSGMPGAEWGTITWNADLPGDASLMVTAASSTDGVSYSASESAADGADLSVPDGQYLQVSVAFARSSGGDSPVLYDLTVSTVGAAACPADLRITSYDADPDGSGDGYVTFTNTGSADASLDACTFGILHPLMETFAYVTPFTQGVTLPAGADYTIGYAGAAPDQTLGGGQLTYDISAQTRGLYDWAAYLGAFGKAYAVGDGVPDATDPDDAVIASAGIYQVNGGPLVEVFWPSNGASKAGPADPFVALKQATAEAAAEVPGAFALGAAYPNPFNPETTIRYSLAEAADVQLTVYDALGRRVRTLVARAQEAGAYAVRWDGRDASGQAVASGVYLYKLEAGPHTAGRTMLLAK